MHVTRYVNSRYPQQVREAANIRSGCLDMTLILNSEIEQLCVT